MKALKILLFIFIISSCAPSIPKNHRTSNIVKQNDEYELLIIDYDYELWMRQNFVDPMMVHPQSFFKYENQRYVRAWNNLVENGRRYNPAHYPFQEYINYDNNIEYPKELDYQLWTYFKYIEDVYGRRWNFPI